MNFWDFRAHPTITATLKVNIIIFRLMQITDKEYTNSQFYGIRRLTASLRVQGLPLVCSLNGTLA
jgi:hypothetical protein